MANSNFRILTLDQLDGVSSVRNYIKNGNASQNTRLWTTYADLAGAAPVDGTGGSPVSTFTRSTISPLALDASFLWDKTAVNRQGEGFSYDFTIDSGLRGSQLAINHLLEVTSGTYVTGDMVCYIYDITNATLIQPSAYQVVSTGIAGPVQPMVFQAASNSTSYRLIFHTSTVSALAYSLKFDNFSVSSQIVPVGAAMSDWTTFVPTGTWAANTTWTGRFRRVGDSMELDVRALLSGAPSGSFTVNLPSGYTIDTAKLAAGANFSPYGVAYANDSGVANYTGTIIYSSTTAVQIVGDNGTAGTLYSATYPTTFGNLDSVTMRYTVPIVGWASNVLSSDSAATRVVSMTATGTQTGTLANGAVNIVRYGTTSADTHGGYDSATGRYTVKVPGYYAISGSVYLSGTFATSGNTSISIFVNGVERFGRYVINQSAIGFTSAQISIPNTLLAAGDLVDIRATPDSWTSVSFVGTTYGQLSLAMVQGPAQIQAATIVAARYSTAAGQSIGTSGATVIWGTKEFDTTNSMNTATGVFTCPSPGYYAINSALVYASAAFTAGSAKSVQFYKNGALHSYTNISCQVAYTGSFGIYGSNLIYCNAGDTLAIFTNANEAAARSLSTTAVENYVTISRMSGVN